MKRSPGVKPRTSVSATAAEADARRPRPVQRIISRPQFAARHSILASSEFEPHSHSTLTVTAVLAGRMTVEIGDASFDLSAGDVAFTNVGQTHGGRALDAEFVSIGISPTLLSELVTEIGVTRTAAEIAFNTSVARDDFVATTLRAIAAEMAGARPGREPMLDAMARQLVIHLLRSRLSVRKSAVVELSRAGPVDRRLRLAIEFMHDNFGRELSIEEIASAAYLSEYYFARLFKQITGVTPHVFLANLRLERARKLLAETGLPISQIAAMVGYQSQSHFTKVFKSVTGLTPRVYREGASVRIQESEARSQEPEVRSQK